MNSTITLSPTEGIAIAAVVILAVMTICGGIGRLIASFHVEPRNNLSHVFGAIFGLLGCMTVAAFFSEVTTGVAALLVTFIYTTFVVRLQRGY